MTDEKNFPEQITWVLGQNFAEKRQTLGWHEVMCLTTELFQPHD